MEQNRQIEKLLGDVANSQSELDRIEQDYKKSKQRVREQIAGTIHQLAVLADTQAVRARILRELYWKRRISAEIIGNAFGLEMRRIAGLAGSYTIQYPCDNECGGTAEETFTSRAELERHESSHGKHICPKCSKLERDELERRALQRKKASQKRAVELRAMSWEEFTDSQEWIEMRGYFLESVGFRCEICNASDVSLNVCLQKDTTEYPLMMERGFFRSGGELHFYVLCQSCIKRCEDLLHPEWRERIKVEFIDKIMDDRMQR